MIDFTACEINKFKAYGGANGNKIHINYQGNGYMLKFPPIPGKNKKMSYSNGCISEYLACHIYASLGIKVQDTLLGTYTDRRGKEKIVVACRDFTEKGKKLIEFAQLKNTCIDSEQNGYGTELSSIMAAIEEQTLIPQEEMKEFFWNMFIADAFLGNFDRHNGNWGVLVEEEKLAAEMAPIYDCGSCLYPQLAAEDMQSVMQREEEIDKRIFLYPTSAVEKEGKKISYFEFISSLENQDCNAALKRIYPRIDMKSINRLVEETPFIEPVQKEFYQIMLRERKEKILGYSMRLLLG
ncbi:MAG: HipA domain-containing protein [Lachnospiraceae bacterium]|nr:HipA domain-containing protein [Lachnospiraceae bacterium]